MKNIIKFLIFIFGFLVYFLPINTTNLAVAGDFTSPSFTINTSDITPGGQNLKPEGKNLSQKVNFLLGTIIQKLMIAIGAIALLIMTIGAGYMIFYHGQDELLSKGKSIFNSGLIALVLALSSYYIISLIRFILYST